MARQWELSHQKNKSWNNVTMIACPVTKIAHTDAYYDGEVLTMRYFLRGGTRTSFFCWEVLKICKPQSEVVEVRKIVKVR